MKVKIFTDINQDKIQDWIDNIGYDIEISAIAQDFGQFGSVLTIFYYKAE